MAPRIFLGERLEPADYDRLPRFTFVEPPISMSRLAGAVLGLALPSQLALTLARRRLGRISVAT